MMAAFSQLKSPHLERCRGFTYMMFQMTSGQAIWHTYRLAPSRLGLAASMPGSPSEGPQNYLRGTCLLTASTSPYL